MKQLPIAIFGCCILFLSSSCKNQSKTSAAVSNNTIDLKRGEIVSCGPADGELYGTVSFSASVPEKLRNDFNMGVALLHSFEYDEAEKMFAKVIDADPDCAMAWWGVAMSNFHPLWAPPLPEELEKGAKAVDIARSLKNKTQRESDFIEAIGKFYENRGQLTHQERVLNYEKEMEKVYATYPDDIEAAVFYSLALNSAADPTDKTYTKQKKAFSILNPIFQKQPLHPGLAHYIIHNYDYPALAEMALPAARRYASIAPASAHAQHMPSHIFTRLGLWDDCIKSNLVAAASAVCYAEKAKLKGHWDEELHTLDYLVYGYLQKGDYENARKQVEYVNSIDEVAPNNFKTAYSFAAIPARYTLERKMWNEAAELKAHPANYPWNKFPWQKAIIHFTHVLGLVQLGKIDKANGELDTLKNLYAALKSQKEKGKEAAQVAVQVKASEAWIAFKSGDKEKGIALMKEAADMEDAMEKHPVTPGEIIPARELLGEMYLEMNNTALAKEAFNQNLKSHPNRLNSLKGAGLVN